MAVIDAIRLGPCTLLEIVELSKVSYSAARYTIRNAKRSGELQICGHERRPHAKCWVRIYELVVQEPKEDECTAVVDSSTLSTALSCWPRSPVFEG